ncbi:hypothetical protein C9J27_05740 [Photobacterium kishitanii]|uniref:Uncharacterized protein n=1 Tax=Photobacterium kishitanii TaxID=318456 RepID=A0A2T3KLT8_9GAMM|nr:hypothetical protein C9J27_05740 [Photobacterium kishitanii]
MDALNSFKLNIEVSDKYRSNKNKRARTKKRTTTEKRTSIDNTSTVRLCIESAKRYTSKREWIRNDPRSHNMAKKLGIIPLCSRNFPTLKSWDKTSCFNEALKYTTRTQWYKSSPSSYIRASHNKWLDECCTHMITIRKRRSLGECINDAKQFSNCSEWRKGNPNSYRAAQFHDGWLSECKKIFE